MSEKVKEWPYIRPMRFLGWVEFPTCLCLHYSFSCPHKKFKVDTLLSSLRNLKTLLKTPWGSSTFSPSASGRKVPVAKQTTQLSLEHASTSSLFHLLSGQHLFLSTNVPLNYEFSKTRKPSWSTLWDSEGFYKL